MDHHPVRVQHAERDGYVPQPAVLDDQAAGHQVGNGHVPPPVIAAPVVATPVVGNQVHHQPHTAGVGSPRRDLVHRNGSPRRDSRESMQQAPDDVVEQEPISENSEPSVRRSNRANKGKMPKALEDFEVEL